MRSGLVLAVTAIFSFFGMAHASTLSALAVHVVASKRAANEPLTFDAKTAKLTELSFSGEGAAVFKSAQTVSIPVTRTTGDALAASPPYISLDLPQPTPILGYTGGSPCTVSSFCSGVANGVQLLEGTQLDDATSGTSAFIPPVPVRPESSGLLMLGAGVLVVGSVMRRHRV